MPRMSAVEAAVSAANSGERTACPPWWASGPAIAGREGKTTKCWHHTHESRFTDHRFTFLLDLEFVEKVAELCVMTRISSLEKKPLLVGKTALILLIRRRPTETRRDEK
jgi:hypothetical protein